MVCAAADPQWRAARRRQATPYTLRLTGERDAPDCLVLVRAVAFRIVPSLVPPNEMI